MEDLKQEGSAKTPVVEFSTSGELLLKGRSIPENSIESIKTFPLKIVLFYI